MTEKLWKLVKQAFEEEIASGSGKAKMITIPAEKVKWLND